VKFTEDAIQIDYKPLPRSFYERPTVEVARALLGQLLVNGPSAGRIVEVEAYLAEGDRAAHARSGLTRRTRVLFGPPGHAYVFLAYGLHYCLNVSAEPEGSPGCVLIRALEPVAGIEQMRRRRPAARRLQELTSGPGRLTAALGISLRHNGADLTSGDLTICRGQDVTASSIQVSTRVGIRHSRELPLRFFIAGNPFVSRPAGTGCSATP